MKLSYLSIFGPTPMLATLSLFVFNTDNVAYGTEGIVSDNVHVADGSPAPIESPPIESRTVTPPNEDCYGEIITSEETTKLDLYNSEITNNTLHLDGGELRYSNIGIVRDEPVDLVVTVDYGTYTDIEQVWVDRGKSVPLNGKNKAFGKLNLQTVDGKPMSGQGNFKFCFHQKGTNNLTKVDTFRWTVFDFDERKNDKTANGIGLKEKMLMDTSQARLYQLWPNEQDSEIKLSCEDGSVVPCSSGIRTVFHSSVNGTGGDNPDNPANMTYLQKTRSVTFTFQDTDCWTFTYDHYCPLEQDHDVIFPLGYDPADNDWLDPSQHPNNNWNKNKCRGYNGGNFLFSGDAEEIISEGECITPPPTTATPTHEPTPAPTKVPTKSPEPVKECIDDGVIVKRIDGVTECPTTPTKPVSIVDVGKDEDGYSTVTVKVKQFWAMSSSVSHVFASYKETLYDEICNEDQDVNGGSLIFNGPITIQCNIMSPWANLKVCVADDLANNVLTNDDNAEIPKCCYPEIPDEHGKVCYNLKISCKPECVDEGVVQEDRRMLRAGN